jgi:hypothetical protein
MSKRLVVLATGVLFASTAVVVQSTVRPIPRVAPYELSVASAAPDLARGPRSEFAQDAAPGETEGTAVSLRGSGTVLQGSDYSDADGSVDTQRGGWEVLLGSTFGDGGLFAFGLGNEASFYDFGGAGFVSGASDPFNDVYETRLRSTIYLPVSEPVSFFTGAELTLGGEDEAEWQDGLTVGAATGFGYRVSPALELSFGLAGASRLSDEAYLLPFLGFDWQLTETTRLIAEGPEVRLEQALGRRFDLELGAAYHQRQFRLNDSGPVSGGVFRDEQIDLSAELRFTPGPRFSVGLEVGASLWRELSFQSAAGENLGEAELAAAPFVGLSLGLTL